MGDIGLAEIGVVYLHRFADGELAVRNFVASYCAHPAGIEHELHVIFKGFPDQCSLARAQSLFSGLSVNSIELEDGSYDVGSYFAAAKLVSSARLIFLNGFTVLHADDWLKKFDAALSLPGVGLVGATGSWQSLSSYYEVIVRLGVHEITQLSSYVPVLLARCRLRGEPKIIQRSYEAGAIQGRGQSWRAAAFNRGLLLLLRPDRYLLKVYEYGRYPNPHIRTNAFMIDRARFLALDTPPFESKSDAYRFERRRRSLTKQIMAERLRPVVVDRRGSVYEVAEWKASSTYCGGRQANLIASDNRTRQYENGSRELRLRLHDYAWAPPSRWTLNVHRTRLRETEGSA